MIFENHVQGSPEWHAARAGACTASMFHIACEKLKRTSGDKKAGDPSNAAEKYAGDIAIERISGQPYGDTFETFAMRRGHEREAAARRAYEMKTGLMAEESGIVFTDDRWFGYSTDGFVDSDGMVEIKCLTASDKIVGILKNGDVSDYEHQMQGGLWITGRAWCDFVLFVPELETVGNELFVKRVFRDENFIEQMEKDLIEFRAMVLMYESIFGKVEMLELDVAEEQDQAELATAKQNPAGAELSPAAHALNEAEGAQRFAATHRELDVAANVVPMRHAQPAPATPPTLTLGAIGTRLGFNLTADFLKGLGFEATKVKASCLYHSEDFQLICARLVAHIQGVQTKRVA